VVDFLTYVFTTYGACEILLSDNGGEFIAQKVLDLLAEWHVKPRNGKPYKPTDQGCIERRNQTAKRRCKKALLQLSQDIAFQTVESMSKLLRLVLNTLNHEKSNATGFPPNELFLGKTDYAFFLSKSGFQAYRLTW
jgi:transposase InsO family protein